jgi:hypothetical protein
MPRELLAATRRVALLAGTFGLGVFALGACTSDGVPTDVDTEPECGNGVVESGEQCDVDSPGCLSCGVVPGWTCTRSGCAMICGDGVVGTDASCADPTRDTDCDLTGYWAARETDYTRDTVVGALQTSSSWQLYHFEQTGDSFAVVEQIECGVHVTGSVTVDETGGTLRALVYRNRMDAKSPHGARRGTSTKVTGGCAVTFDRWYVVRGVSEEKFLPTDFAAKPALGDLPPLPSVADPVKSLTFPPEAEDWDGDHIPGVAYRISGFVQGVRNSVQRDWREFATFLDHPIPARALEFTVPGAFDLQEKVLNASQCGGLCSLVVAPANPARDVVARMTLSFIGKTLSSKRVSTVIGGAPRLSLDDDLATCARVRQLLPHDTSTPTPVPK